MLELRDVTKAYPVSGGEVQALRGVSLRFRTSEFVAVLGPSGCGKTTLLNVIGGLDHATTGELVIDGVSTARYRDADWDGYRNHRVGFVFQSYNLIEHQSVLANVEMALRIGGVSAQERRERAKEALVRVGLSDQMDKRPNMLSGGQMQRVAIARALVSDPDIVLADEPTGALDSKTSEEIMELLAEVARDRLVVMVTHNPELAARHATRTVRLLDGQVVEDTDPPEAEGAGATPDAAAATAAGAAEGARQKPRKHAHLGFVTALELSATNLLTKKGRTALTACAGAIGIVGIALVLALSSGMNDYIAQTERDTMGSYPLTVERTSSSDAGMAAGPAITLASDDGEDSAEDGQKDVILSDNVVADGVSRDEASSAVRDLSAFNRYLNAHEGELDGSATAIEKNYDVVPQVFRTQGDEVVRVSPASLKEGGSGARMPEEVASIAGMAGQSEAALTGSVTSEWSQLPASEELRAQGYELVTGTWPEGAEEIALVIDEDGKVSDYTLYLLGLLDLADMDELVDAVRAGEDYEDAERTIPAEDALGLGFDVLSSSDLYEPVTHGDADGGETTLWERRADDGAWVASRLEEALHVEIVGVLRLTEDSSGTAGVAYTPELTSALMERAAESEPIQQQLADPETSVLDGSPLEGEKDLEDVFAELGYAEKDRPSSVSIYPADFDGKEAVEGFIETYNAQAKDAEQVSYTDLVGTMTSALTSVVDIVSYVLIAFVAISLVVSSIMIGIITYISVLERTKEIGILRAIGASKCDVTRIFNAETVIEGLASGIIGVTCAWLLCIPVNAVISTSFGVEGLAALSPAHAAALVCVSVALTLVAGFLPARSAAKRDPAVTLRSA